MLRNSVFLSVRQGEEGGKIASPKLENWLQNSFWYLGIYFFDATTTKIEQRLSNLDKIRKFWDKSEQLDSH